MRALRPLCSLFEPERGQPTYPVSPATPSRPAPRGPTRMIPTPEDARLLEQPRNQPILFVESVDLDEQGIPIVFHEVRFAGDRVQLTVES